MATNRSTHRSAGRLSTSGRLRGAAFMLARLCAPSSFHHHQPSIRRRSLLLLTFDNFPFSRIRSSTSISHHNQQRHTYTAVTQASRPRRLAGGVARATGRRRCSPTAARTAPPAALAAAATQSHKRVAQGTRIAHARREARRMRVSIDHWRRFPVGDAHVVRSLRHLLPRKQLLRARPLKPIVKRIPARWLLKATGACEKCM